MSNLYQDAILDAKALRASAIANAKAALEEAFEPKIQEMLRAKLSEEEVSEIAEAEEIKEEAYEDGMEEAVAVEESTEINEQELDEILAQLEELDQVEESAVIKEEAEEELDEAKEEEEGGEEEEAGEGEAEAGEEGEAPEAEEEMVDDETKVIDITLGDLKQVLQSVMGAQADLGMPAEEPTADSEAEADAGLDLDEILAELESSERVSTANIGADVTHQPNVKQEGEVNEIGIADIPAEAYDAILQGVQDLAKTNADGAKNLINVFGSMAGGGALIAALRKMFPGVKDTMDKTSAVGSAPKGLTKFEAKDAELKEAKATIQTLRKDLQEVNLLNAKYLYMNKLFKSKSLTESQKVKVINALDRATTVAEVKNAYETLKESFETKKQQIKESIGFASKPAGVAPKANIVEADQFISRWQKLAGINK